MPIVSALVKLSEKAKLHPKSLVLQDVRVNGSYPVAGGAAFDLWKGDTNGHLIAIKMVHYVVDIRAYCKEVVLWRQLASPYVLPFYGVCHKPENPLYMGVVMPWMENGNILQYLKNCPHADKYSLALDVARGIDYLHSFKPSVVHGDLKGANILITPSFTACVADVGLRALFPVPGETYDFETLNTASETSKYYMAPELLVGNENPEDAPRTRNLASDIYSLGCVLHEIFTGNPQFVGFSFPQLLLAHLQNHRPARPPIPEMDDFMWELISQCCNKDPSHRPQASDIIHSLRTRMVHPELDIPLCAWDAEIMDRLRAQSVSSPLKELSLSGDLDDLKESEVSESSSCIYSMASTVSSGVDISSIISIDDNQKRPLTEDDIIIAIIGPIGTGKSTFINIATESKRATVGRDLESCTQDIVAFTFPHPNDSNRNIVFVDTPGFDGSIRSDYDILRELSRWLETTYRRGITLAGILLFHRISEPRIRGTPLRNLKVFEELCGLRNVILTTTMWDEVNNEVGMRHEEQLKTVFWGPMMKYGCRTARFSSTYDSAWEIVNQLDINSRLPAIIQEEMVEQGKNLSETAFHFIAQRWKQLVDPREALNRIRWSSTEKSVLRQELDAALLQQQTVEVRLRSLNAKTLGIRYRDIRRETSIGSRTALNRPKNLRESSAESSVGNGSKLIYSHLFSHTLELMKHYKPKYALVKLIACTRTI
ncbi:kinase-like domain-containing protein [Hygrophoropsis aurantiaca]|uniref:Kinase-like domain-containing protein n=1 Tax=Hygrophoropsis aurantiaca TaxID=72124 RepID=A0ACB7ZVY8_9AGAM|nr:kinase-like domain-containing protein [Hygrophoropsis aurantiaca]